MGLAAFNRMRRLRAQNQAKSAPSQPKHTNLDQKTVSELQHILRTEYGESGAGLRKYELVQRIQERQG